MKILALACALGATAITSAAEAHPQQAQYGYGGSYAPPVQRYAPPLSQYEPYGYPPRHQRKRRHSYAPEPYQGAAFQWGYPAQQSYAPPPAYRPYSPPYGYAPDAYGYNSAANGPTSEGYNFGYSGGPTFGMGRRPVINGVQIFGSPD